MVEWMREKKKKKNKQTNKQISHRFGGAVEFQKWQKNSLIIRCDKDYSNSQHSIIIFKIISNEWVF